MGNIDFVPVDLVGYIDLVAYILPMEDHHTVLAVDIVDHPVEELGMPVVVALGRQNGVVVDLRMVAGHTVVVDHIVVADHIAAVEVRHMGWHYYMCLGYLRTTAS